MWRPLVQTRNAPILVANFLENMLVKAKNKTLVENWKNGGWKFALWPTVRVMGGGPCNVGVGWLIHYQFTH